MIQAIRFGLAGLALGTGACALVADIHEGKPRKEEGSTIPLPECTGGPTIVLAMNHIFLGDTDPDGTANPTNGWKSYGFNLDRRISTKTSTDLCKPTSGGTAAAVYPDGPDGIDNSFGKNFLPILLGLASDLSTSLEESIAKGEFTYMLQIDNVGQGMPCSTSSKLFRGVQLGTMPLWNGNDSWPIDPDSLTNPSDQSSAKVVFSTGDLVDNVYTSAQASEFDLTLGMSGVPFQIPIHHVSVQMQLDPDQQGATRGIIAGVVGKEELASAMAKIASAFDTSFCDPQSPTLMSILNQIRQASDIMIDGSQNPSLECEGISIGLGFTMRRVTLGPVGTPPAPLPDSCKCYEHCAEVVTDGSTNPNFCPTSAGMNAATLFDVFRTCTCNGPCAGVCGNNYCLGSSPDAPCAMCLQTGSCSTEFSACAADI